LLTPTNAQVLKADFHISFTKTPTCFVNLHIILRELYVEVIYQIEKKN